MVSRGFLFEHQNHTAFQNLNTRSPFYSRRLVNYPAHFVIEQVERVEMGSASDREFVIMCDNNTRLRLAGCQNHGPVSVVPNFKLVDGPACSKMCMIAPVIATEIILASAGAGGALVDPCLRPNPTFELGPEVAVVRASTRPTAPPKAQVARITSK